MAKDKLSELNDLSKKIGKDILAITKVKYRNVIEWRVGIFDDMNFVNETVKNYSLFLIYKIDNSNDCRIIYNALLANTGLGRLNFPNDIPVNPKYIILWHSMGIDAEDLES